MKVVMYLIKERALFHILLVLRTVRAPHTQSVLSIKNSHHDSLFACNNTEACTLVICRSRVLSGLERDRAIFFFFFSWIIDGDGTKDRNLVHVASVMS